MIHPFQTGRMRELKRRSSVLFALMCILKAPALLVWGVAEVAPNLVLRIDELVRFLMTPFRVLGAFLQAWFGGRLWHKLWIASPVLVIAFVGFTIFYINVNQNRGKAYAIYYQGAVKAMMDGDFTEADFLFAKLIHHPAYKENNEVLFRAMLSAGQSGNVTRVNSLQKKLVDEREYDPAKRWYVERFLSTKKPLEGEADKCLLMALKSKAEATSTEDKVFWRLSIARIYARQRLFQEALANVEMDTELTPEGYLLRAQLLVNSGDRSRYLGVLRKMLDYIEFHDPLEKRYFNEKVEGWALLAANARTAEEALETLPKAKLLVERKSALSLDKRATYQKWLSELNIRMFLFELQKRTPEARRRAFAYFEKAVADGTVTNRAGSTILSVVNGTAKVTLLTGQLREIAAKDGGCAIHMALGMDAWLQNNPKRAEQHFRIAHAVNVGSLDVLRALARDLAKRAVNAQLDLAVFRGVNKSNYQRSQDLLQLVANIDEEERVQVLFDLCYVYSLRNDAEKIIEVLEAELPNLKENEKLTAYRWLVGSSRGIEDKERVSKYASILAKEVRKKRKAE